MLFRSIRGPLMGALVTSLSAVACLCAAASAQASTLPTLTIAITKSSISIAGAPQSGGVNVISTVTGVKEANAILFLLKPGVSVAELESGLMGGDPNRATKYGSIVFDAEPTPGHSSEAQTVLQPGQYVALAPAKHQKPRVQLFTVKAATSPATLPAPEATIRSVEFAFTGPSTLHDGELVRFENEGFLVHMTITFPVKSHRAATQAVKDLKTGNERGLEKLAAGEPMGFAGPLSHEAFQQETITAKPGWYVLACFMNTQDGREHTRLGMERIIKITK